MSVAISFRGISKSYVMYHHFTKGLKNLLFDLPGALRAMKNTRFEALQGITFDVEAGETLGIIGNNGAGKSTMLGLVAGVLKPTSGDLTVMGRVSPLLELGGGFHHALTGRENIILNSILLGMTKKEAMRKLDSIIEFSELGSFIEQPIRTYSSGMLARLGFSVVAFLDPRILLVDEVLAVGDQEFQRKCLEKMIQFKRDGVTIVFVSHNMDDVLMICDRVVWIDERRIRMSGTPREVVGEYIKATGGRVPEALAGGRG